MMPDYRSRPQHAGSEAPGPRRYRRGESRHRRPRGPSRGLVGLRPRPDFDGRCKEAPGAFAEAPSLRLLGNEREPDGFFRALGIAHRGVRREGRNLREERALASRIYRGMQPAERKGAAPRPRPNRRVNATDGRSWSDGEARSDLDTVLQRAIDGTPFGVEAVDPLDDRTSALRCSERHTGVTALDDEDPVLRFDLAAHFRGQLSAARVDVARLQRTAEPTEPSPVRRGDDVIQGRGVRFAELGRAAPVVGRDGAMHAEDDRPGLTGKARDPHRAGLANDVYVRYVDDSPGMMAHSSAHSARSATTGSTRAALRAGT